MNEFVYDSTQKIRLFFSSSFLVILNMYFIDSFDYRLDGEQLLKQEPLRFKNILKRPRIANAFHSVVQEVSQIVVPKFGFQRFPIQAEHGDGFLLENGTIIGSGKVFKKVMKGSTELIMGMGTLGPAIDLRISELGKIDQMQAVIMDSIASYLISVLSNEVNYKCMDLVIQEKKHHSIVMAPGDTEWDIRDQEKLFQLLNPNLLGMHLSESMLMIPTKSVSFAIGVSQNPYEIHDMERCVFCPRKNTCDGYILRVKTSSIKT
jgi:hypothetical protein